MKHVFPIIVALALFLTACGGPKTYGECSYEQKRVLDAAGAFSLDNRSAKGAELTDDPVLVTVQGGTEYIYLPIGFTVDGAEREDVAMIKGNGFVCFASDEIPTDDLGGNISSYRAGEILSILECMVIWGNYGLYGKDMVGKRIGETDLIVQSVAVVDKNGLAALFPRWAESAGK